MTAQIIQFPVARARAAALSPVARAVYRDMQIRAVGGFVHHSVNDGIRCSGALRHRVVQARRDLQSLGLVELLEPGNGNGPAVWRLTRIDRAADLPDGAA